MKPETRVTFWALGVLLTCLAPFSMGLGFLAANKYVAEQGSYCSDVTPRDALYEGALRGSKFSIVPFGLECEFWVPGGSRWVTHTQMTNVEFWGGVAALLVGTALLTTASVSARKRPVPTAPK
jgi:hypothetical protein